MKWQSFALMIDSFPSVCWKKYTTSFALFLLFWLLAGGWWQLMCSVWVHLLTQELVGV